jgi:hypothetical protein
MRVGLPLWQTSVNTPTHKAVDPADTGQLLAAPVSRAYAPILLACRFRAGEKDAAGN